MRSDDPRRDRDPRTDDRWEAGSRDPEPPDPDGAEGAPDEGDASREGEGAPVVVPIEPVLDLHSFQPREVASVLEEYLLEALRAGFDEVRIVHGRGIGVQREIVRTVLSRSPFVVSFRDARPEAGGWGATIALLRRH
jgi:dsDNA-specific endonuclease/ATPase MutS2